MEGGHIILAGLKRTIEHVCLPRPTCIYVCIKILYMYIQCKYVLTKLYCISTCSGQQMFPFNRSFSCKEQVK